MPRIIGRSFTSHVTDRCRGTRAMPRGWRVGVGLVVLLTTAPVRGADPNGGPPVEFVPERYPVHYPAAERFCPPIRTAFVDALQTIYFVKGRRARVPVNGGYGVAEFQVQGVPMRHAGADLGWFREGEPVFAVADGVVRLSQPPVRRKMAARGVRALPKGPFDYGNLIVVEHRTADGRYFHSLYGHLGDDRLVRAGDLVTAGQHIGAIGRKSVKINGGFEPHLHFGLRDGRQARPGMKLFDLTVNGQATTIHLTELGKDRIQVTLVPDWPDLSLHLTGDVNRTVRVTAEGDKRFLPANVLYHLSSSVTGIDFGGYSATLEGWSDPVAFLRARQADTDPAPLMYVSPFEDVPDTSLLGRSAPAWNVAEWIQPADTPPLGVTDFRGRVVCLFCVQATCRASQTHGLPTLQHVARHYQADPQIAVVALQTAVRDPRRNSPAALQRLARDLQRDIPLGHCPSARQPPPIIADYGLRGTPWTVLIDREGTVQFSNYTVRPEELIRRIEALRP